MQWIGTAITAMIALLICANTAFAWNAVTVEGPSGICGNTQKTDCDIHVVNSGLWEFEDEVFGSHIAACNVELDLHIAQAGTGTLDGIAFTGKDMSCAGITPCSSPWEFVTEEANGVVDLHIDACVESPQIPNPENKCEGEIYMTLDHPVTELHTLGETEFGDCGVNGELQLESGSPDLTIH